MSPEKQLKQPVLDKKGKEKENISLPDDIFGQKVNPEVIHQAVLMYQASLRQGNASTKERGAVSGGGKKPFRQKGTGEARAGSNRSPLWAGGGVVFGPHPRDFKYSVPTTIRRIALGESLNGKYLDKQLFCIEDLKDSFKKTKEFVQILDALKIDGSILAILDGSDKSIERVTRNIPHFDLMRAQDVNAYEVLKRKNILVTKTALTNLINRIIK